MRGGAPKLLISPLVGEMSGKAEGARRIASVWISKPKIEMTRLQE
ncbi:hypothetical protein X755_05295 [Mesorhizobium sp. LNJC405B00]|nr:hypothetical protein X755_05295 [Mesorhizobium sp. LNJC405B00]